MTKSGKTCCDIPRVWNVRPPPAKTTRFPGFRMLLQAFYRTPWRKDWPVVKPLPTHDNTNIKTTHIYMLLVGFEPWFPMSERQKTAHTLYRAGCERLIRNLQNKFEGDLCYIISWRWRRRCFPSSHHWRPEKISSLTSRISAETCKKKDFVFCYLLLKSSYVVLYKLVI